jgi:tetratricopeptide (TPR) repeat protein
LPAVTVTSFIAFANLVVAACKLASTATIPDRLKALADIASGARSLDAALATTGLAAVAQEMARTAEDHARHFTHPGRARDDAIALFWQVAPAAFADPATFAAAHLDPALTTDRMVAAIKASPMGRDFTAAPLPEQFFRAVAQSTLQVMLARADAVAALAPALWRESLETTAAIKDDTTEILALVRELHAIRSTTVPEIALIAMARKITPRVADRDEALRALDAAADLAAEAQARGEAGSNVDAFVDATLRRLAALTAEGRLDEAAVQADAAIGQAETGLTRLLDAAIAQHLLAFDAEGAARQIVRRVTLATEEPGFAFDSLMREQQNWHERGRTRGLRLDLKVATLLASRSQSLARNPDQQGRALHSLGAALWTLGDRESDPRRLNEAVIAYRSALAEHTRERVPLAWAAIQRNLGAALRSLGERQGDPARLQEAVAACRAALEVTAREDVPLEWARTQIDLGVVLAALGHGEGGTLRLQDAVAAFRAALEVMTRERAPGAWAMIQANLGSALSVLGERELDAARLEEAVAAFRAALAEWTRDREPVNRARIQRNLGTALRALGELEHDTVRLGEAVTALRSALEETSRESASLDWAGTQMSLGMALATLGELERDTAALEDAVHAYDAALEECTLGRAPVYWAMTMGYQGDAMRALAERRSDAAFARRAYSQIAAAEAALRVRGRVSVADYCSEQLSQMQALIFRLSGGNEG